MSPSTSPSTHHLSSFFSILLLLLLPLLPHTLAKPNGRCNLSDGTPGTCIPTSQCRQKSGSSTPNFCLDDSDPDIQCCTATCSSGGETGQCAWASTCTGTTVTDLCPGPAEFKCCFPEKHEGSEEGGKTKEHELSEKGAEFIAGFEGFRKAFYSDAAGVKTIGYGHACQPSSECNSISPPITEKEGQGLLKSDAATFVKCINNDVEVPLTQNQFDALVSFTYNLGCGNLGDIAELLNKKNFDGATAAMKKYTHAGGRELEGLVTRRKKEVQLFNT